MSKQAITNATRTDLFLMDPAQLTIIGLDTPDKENHPLYDSRIHLPLDEAMVKNIMTFGVLEPVLVRKNGENIEVLDGKQRVRHAREANKRLEAQGSKPLRISVLAPKRESDKNLAGIMVSANEIRRSDEWVQRAEKALKLLNFGYTKPEIANLFNVSMATVTQWLMFFDLDETIKAKIVNGDLAPSTATLLAKFSHEQQKEELLKLEKAKDNNGKSKIRKNSVIETISKSKSKPLPGKKLLKGILKHQEYSDILPNGFLAALEWILGEIQTEDIPGLSEILKELEK
jgi:ParB family chromosome partitioning protein